MAFPAFLDTCVLYPINLTDVLLRLPDYDRSYRPLWSAGVIEELERNLTAKTSMTPARVAKRVGAYAPALPGRHGTGYDALIPQMNCHEKDRPVLAAAVVGNAEVIVTFNLKDFPAAALEPYDISVVHPDAFLLDQLDLYPEATLTAVVEAVGDRNNPPETIHDFLKKLGKLTPDFVTEIKYLV